MEQNAQDKNQNFFSKYQNWLIVIGIIIIVAIVFFATKKKTNNNDQTSSQNQQQSSDTVSGSNSQTNTPNPTPASNTQTNQTVSSLTIRGTLTTSDNLSRGNLLLNSTQGKIYIRTVRDYSAWMQKQVTLQAQGTINSFTFLGFAEAQVAQTPTDNTAMGGGDIGLSTISVSGQLNSSDNSAKGNYMINSTQGKIYLQTVHDYSSWVGTNVSLSAQGSIQSFTNATLTQK
jgi:hypothetical protein